MRKTASILILLKEKNSKAKGNIPYFLASDSLHKKDIEGDPSHSAVTNRIDSLDRPIIDM